MLSYSFQQVQVKSSAVNSIQLLKAEVKMNILSEQIVNKPLLSNLRGHNSKVVVSENPVFGVFNMLFIQIVLDQQQIKNPGFKKLRFVTQ